MAEIKWYKRDPDAALTGMMQLTLEERGAYSTVLDLIYSRQNRLPDDDRFIAGFLRSDVRVWKRIKARLIALEKLYVEGGYIRNHRADVEVLKASQIITKASSAGRASASARKRSRGDAPQHTPQHTAASIAGAPQQETDTYDHKSDVVFNENKDIGQTDVATVVGQPFQQSTSTSTTRIDTNNHHHPLRLPREDDDADDFEKLDRALRAIPGIDRQPVNAVPVIAPIWQLARSGIGVRSVIIPSVTRQVATAKGPIRSWSYFVPGIQQDAMGSPANGPVVTVPRKEWESRLRSARMRKAWPVDDWGPMPGTSACTCPADLLHPDDGQGWGTKFETAA